MGKRNKRCGRSRIRSITSRSEESIISCYKRIDLPSHIYDELLKIALEATEKERCGVIGGKIYGEVIMGMVQIEIPNIASSSNEFYMDPLSLYRAIQNIRSRGIDIVAIYHTHPVGCSAPSLKDLDGMALWPIPWIIITPDRNISAWHKCRKGLIKLDLNIV